MIHNIKTDSDFYRRLFRLMLTIALQNLIVFGVSLADNIMLGAYSETALSGAATVNQIQFFLQMLVVGAGDGIVVLASRHWGEGDTASVKRIGAIGMRIGLALTAVLFSATLFFPSACVGLFSNVAEITAEGAAYLSIVCLSYPFFCVTNVLLSTLRSVETVRIGFAVSIVTFFTNIILNSLLIFGNLGFPEMGARGAALATLISRVIETLIVVAYVRFGDKKLRIRLRDYLSATDKEYLRRFIKYSSPVILSNMSWGIAMGAQVSLLGHMEGSVIAANSIANTLFQILSVALYGSASATGVLIGKSMGEGAPREIIIERAKTLQVIYVCLGLLTGAALFSAKDFVLSFYRVSETTRSLALTFISVLSVTVIGTSYQMPCLTGIVRGGGDTKFVLYNDLIFIWLIVLPSAYLSAFVFGLPPMIVFCCLKSDQILKCIVAAVKVNRFKWVKQLK